MGFVDSSAPLIATCGGDTVKLFDLTVSAGDPCTLSYTPSPGSQVNSIKWNHTNLVIASAGDDKKISLWNKNGQSMGFITSGHDLVDHIEMGMSGLLTSILEKQDELMKEVQSLRRENQQLRQLL